MNKNMRKMLGGMSTASLILAGALPVAGQWGTEPHSSCPTRSKTKREEMGKDKAEDNTAAKKKVQKTADKAPAAKEKAAK